MGDHLFEAASVSFVTGKERADADVSGFDEFSHAFILLVDDKLFVTALFVGHQNARRIHHWVCSTNLRLVTSWTGYILFTQRGASCEPLPDLQGS